MQPVSPVVPGVDLEEMVYAKDQPQYLNLPCFRDPDGTVVTRWAMTWRERLQALWTGNIYVTCLTFNKPLQPLKLSTTAPAIGAMEVERHTTEVLSDPTKPLSADDIKAVVEGAG